MTEEATRATRGQAMPDRAIAGVIALFRGHTVLVLGDVMLDRYVSGEVSRISPEAPIPVLRVTGSRASLGGAANVAHNGGASHPYRRRRRRSGGCRDRAPRRDSRR